MFYSDALRSTQMQDVVAAIDAGSSNGTFEICSADYDAVLCSLKLEKTTNNAGRRRKTFGLHQFAMQARLAKLIDNINHQQFEGTQNAETISQCRRRF
jgi:hypothetical protein